MESDSTNNCSTAVTVTVGAAPAPDLAVDTPTVDESAPTGGTRFTLSATVRNQGTGPSSSTTLHYYRSTDETITTSDTPVGTDSVSGLSASGSSPEFISLTAPSTAGTYYYGACVDSVTGESDSTNNCSATVTVTVTGEPDLVVDTPTVSESDPMAGESFTLNATVRNRGHGASNPTTLRYYRSTDSTITIGDTEVGTDQVSGLNASGTSAESIGLTASSTPGTYYYGACVDSVTDESDTSDNCSTAVTIAVGSTNTYEVGDLLPGVPTTGLFIPAVVSDASLSSSGGNTTITFTNGGYIELQDGTRYTCQSAGGCGVHNGEITKGTIVGESASVLISDLIVDPPTVSESSPTAGASFTLSATVRNQGNGPSGSTTLRYYRSTDSTITTSDTPAGTDSVSRLDGLETRDESISVTAPSDPGTYYYGACVESVSGESDTTNNCSAPVTVNVGAAPAPDLVVNTPTVSESSPTAGASFTLSATVRNQGNGPSGSTTLRYYRSTDSTITTSDTPAGTDSVSRLDGLETRDESISVTAPSDPGTYYYGACVESVSGESDTTNNCSAPVTVNVGAAPAPDLVVNTPTVSESSPTAGASFTLSATVRNQGNGPSGSTTLRYYRSTDSTITTSDTPAGTDSVSRLDGLETGDESISVTAPSDPGTYYYGACVDEVRLESDSTNNCSAAVTVNVGAAPAPDLVVNTPTVSESSPTAGASFTLNATVRNQGSSSSASTTLRYYRSTDATITTSDTSVGTDSVSGLNASGSSPQSISLTAPSTPGTYYYGACVDSVTSESEATNNCSAAVTVTVGAAPAPDLVVDTPTVSDNSPAAGVRFTLNATVRNQGNGTSDNTTLRYYRSNDMTITTSDTEVGTDQVEGLGVGEGRGETVSLTAPSDPGAYYYGACVDSVTGEIDTANNCSAAVTVTVGAAPDLMVDTPTASESAPAAGTSFTLSVTVRNQGSSSAGFTTLRYYSSIDTNLYPELPEKTFNELAFRTDSVGTLAPSGSSTHSISLRAWDWETTRYYKACVDSVTGENNTANNCSAAVTVTVTGTPDLVVDTPTMEASGPAAGERFTLSATVRNQGNGSSPATTLHYYRSTDSTISSSDPQVGSVQVSSLSATGASVVSANLISPADPGAYYYGACVGLVEGESSTTNNCSTALTVTVVPTLGPDLAVDTPTSASSHPTVGTSFRIVVSVRNQGSGASGPTTLRFYRSTDPTITTSDERIDFGDVIGLGSTETVYLYSDPRAPSTPGTYYYGACVLSVTDETNTENNCSPAVAIIAVDQPDLVVETPWISHSSATAVSYIDLHAVVRNQGKGPVQGFPAAAFDVFLSTDSTIGLGDTRANGFQWRHMNISSGSEEGLTVSFRVPSTAGEYYYYACVEVVRGESDTTNNCSAAVKVTVRPSDLTILLPTVSSYGTTAGATITLYATVLNQGDVLSPDSSTTIRYYRSTDATITSADTSVGTDWVIVPNAHATSDKSFSLTAPSEAGTYYYGACVDTIADESSSTNNCSDAVEVTVGPKPLSLSITSCFVFQEQHFATFEVTAGVALSSVVVKTYQVEGRNSKLHLMETINVGNLAAGSSYSKLTSRYFPAHLRRHLTTCTAHAEWDNGRVAPDFNPGSTTVPDLPPPPPTYTAPAYDPSEFRTPTQGQVWGLFIGMQGTIYRHHISCGRAGTPPCPWQDHIAWWSALPSGLQRCASFVGCHFPKD